MDERRHRQSTLERKRTLIDAAVAIVGESGYASVTHRAVTARAGLPATSIGYFFSSIDELAQEAMRVFVAEDFARLEQLAAFLDTTDATPDQVIAAFAESARARRPDSLALIEAYLRAARDPGARVVVQEYVEAADKLAQAASALAGARIDAETARGAVALINGFTMIESALPETTEIAVKQRALRTMLIGALFEQGHEDAARALRDG
ncbi:TetR/AcrR family transcriptional regulator [Tsukamurella paurometabola]|uniref:TetR family transcriptional regulator n=1 Tax=Tsukamurella paurometabola TaxID=2061 RepID=A0ABS5NKF5_TSUPA|nr:TetR family transcriptional regulator [Tsukamurella paurometabola]MBS4104403.1 TetR family transcriptional regulator [Tsukamurella paurometabola]